MKNEIINDLLGYEGLKIIQRPDIFNFSLDSTLLASFVTINKSDKKIIDLGTGNAPIPLFLTLRTKAKIFGVELQTEIYDLAKRSVKLNNLEEQIEIINADARKIHQSLGVSTFDIVTVNPPYFPYQESSNINKNDYLTIARHEVYFNLDEVLQTSRRLLKDGGRLAMVHRAERMMDILETFRKYQIEPKRIRFVYPKQNSTEALAILIEGIMNGKKGSLKVLKPLYVYNNKGKYTTEILKIFNYQGK